MLIRPPAPGDLTAITQLTIDTFGPFYEQHFRPLVGELIFANQHGNWRTDYHRQVAALHDPDQHKHLAIADVEGTIAGYVAFSVDPDNRNGNVEMLAVDEQHRRLGAGRELCEHAFAEMRELGADVVQIGTGGDPFHAPARALYEGLGCTPLPLTVYYRQL